MNDNTTKSLAIIIAFLIVVFLAPLFCMTAWNIWAWKFNLPQFGYWEWFATCLAIRLIRSKIGSINDNGD